MKQKKELSATRIVGAAVGVSFAEKFGEQVAGQKPVAAVDAVTYLRGLDLALDQSGFLQLLEVLRDGGLGYGQYFVDLPEKATLLRGKKAQDGHPGRMAHRFGKAGDLFLVFRIAFRCHLFSGFVRKYTNIWPHLQTFPAFFVRCRAGIFHCRGAPPCGMPKRVRGIYASALQRFRLYAGWGLLLPAHFRFGRADLFRLHVVPIFGPLFSNLDLFSYLCKVIYTQRNEYGQTDRNDRQRD